MRPLSALVLTLPFLPACEGPSRPQAVPEPQEASVRPGANDRFLAPDLDVPEFVQTFEGESREIARCRDAIAASLELEPGMAVADVGAGTGLFLDALASAVGRAGRVYAVEISPGFLEHLSRRVADEEGLAAVQVVPGEERSLTLPDGSLDAVFVCDTYHHFEYPRSMLASVHRALRPGGLLVVVDFEREPGVSREWVLGHVRAGKETVVREIQDAGFELQDEVPVDGLGENYLVRFRRSGVSPR